MSYFRTFSFAIALLGFSFEQTQAFSLPDNFHTQSTPLVLEPLPDLGAKVAGVYWLPDYLDKNLDFTNRSQGGGEKPKVDPTCNNMGYAIPAFVSDWSKYDYTKFLAANAVYCYKNFSCKSNFSKSSCPQWYQLAGSSCTDARGTFYERCDPKPCPATYTAGVTSCSPAAGYNYSSNGYSGTQTCGKCTAKACVPGYSTSVTSCATGYSFATNGMSGSSSCGICNQRPCSDGGYYDTNPDSTKYKCNAVTYGGKTCQSCYQPQCTEGGYQTGSTKTGYICKAASYYGRSCYDCSTPDPCYNLTDKAPCTYGCETTYSQCTSKCSKCYADNCRNRTAVSTPYGCQAAFADCSSKCQIAYPDNCRNRTAVSTPYGCQTAFSDCSSKCQVAYPDNCRNRAAVNCTLGCASNWSDCPSKCQTCKTDNCANRTAVDAPRGCVQYWDDCKSKCEIAYGPACQIGDIYYSDNTCAAAKYHTKKTTKTVLGVVVYTTDNGNHGQILTYKYAGIANWCTNMDYVDIPKLPNMATFAAASKDFNSCNNTKIITDFGGRSVYAAAWMAKDYAPTSATAGKWCLPAAGIIYTTFQNDSVIKNSMNTLYNTTHSDVGSIYRYSYPSTTLGHTSTEQDGTYVWLADGRTGITNEYNSKYSSVAVWPVLEF